jgi:hypothetical protein
MIIASYSQANEEEKEIKYPVYVFGVLNDEWFNTTHVFLCQTRKQFLCMASEIFSLDCAVTLIVTSEAGENPRKEVP